MNRMIKAQVALEEKRRELGKLLDLEERAEDYDGKVAAAKAAIEAAQNELAAAALLEPETPEKREQTSEGREIRQLLSKSSLDAFIQEAMGSPLEGAEAELRAALLPDVSGSYLPLEMLLPRTQSLETRADAVTNIATAIQENQQSIMGRVFAQSALEYLGVNSPTVAPGTNSYPRISAGTTADIRSDAAELDGGAATLANEQINPVRLTASYNFGVETLARVSGFEEALREDLRGVLMEKRDALAINGQAAVTDTSPKVDGIINSLTDPTNPTAVAAFDDYLSAYDDHVDGKYAMTSGDVRMLVNPDTYKQAMGLKVGTGGAAVLFRDQLPAGRFRVSANMPATASTIATALTYAAGAPGRGFYMPTWAGLEVVVDRFTGAKAGRRLLTVIMVLGWDMVDSAPYKRLEFKVA